MKTILIVEDEISYLNLLHKELSAKGYSIVDAKDGKEGYDTALLVHPDLIITDILMQGVDGLTMLEQLRANKEGKSMKIIILTNLEPDNALMQRALISKPLYFFVKSDISLNTLIAKVEEELADQEIQEFVDDEHKGVF